jgi:post-segregation antitoxin (ccd killing protein)
MSNASTWPIGVRRARTGRINLTVALSEESYRRAMEFKKTHKISLSALVREWMKQEVEKFEAEARRKQGNAE